MVKMVVLLIRADGWSHDEFERHLREEHAPIAADLPGLQHYSTAVPGSPENSEYDGVSELAFEDMSALRAAFDSEVGEETMADAETFADMDASVTLYVEETVHVDRGD